MQYQFLAIEGNIGAGKTTLARMLSAHFNGKLIPEQYADNPFLPEFYKNPAQNAFPLELFFLAGRYKQLKENLHTKDLFNGVTVADYLFAKSLLFAKVNLRDEEYRLYQQLFEILHTNLVHPDLLLYLHVPVSRLQQNIRSRNRVYEQNISDDYLVKIQDAYVQYIKQHSFRSLIIDASKADFEHNPDHFRDLLDALEKDYGGGPHYLTLE